MQPLDGKRIVVTRAEDQAEEMLTELRRRGAEPLLMPCIATVPLDAPALDDALDHPAHYAWIVFTSTNAVRFLFARPNATRLLAMAGRPGLAVIGTATAKALAEQGLEPDAMPARFTGPDLAAVLGDLRDKRLLLPRSRRGRVETLQPLIDQGADVDDLPIYDTISVPPTPSMLAELRKGVHAITFTSPSTVDGFFAGATPALVHAAVLAAIGPTTAAALSARGLTVHVQPREFTTDAMLDALEQHFRNAS